MIYIYQVIPVTFSKHMNNSDPTGTCKSIALKRITKWITIDRAKMLCDAFINTQFIYALIILQVKTALLY